MQDWNYDIKELQSQRLIVWTQMCQRFWLHLPRERKCERLCWATVWSMWFVSDTSILIQLYTAVGLSWPESSDEILMSKEETVASTLCVTELTLWCVRYTQGENKPRIYLQSSMRKDLTYIGRFSALPDRTKHFLHCSTTYNPVRSWENPERVAELLFSLTIHLVISVWWAI